MMTNFAYENDYEGTPIGDRPSPEKLVGLSEQGKLRYFVLQEHYSIAGSDAGAASTYRRDPSRRAESTASPERVRKLANQAFDREKAKFSWQPRRHQFTDSDHEAHRAAFVHFYIGERPLHVSPSDGAAIRVAYGT